MITLKLIIRYLCECVCKIICLRLRLLFFLIRTKPSKDGDSCDESHECDDVTCCDTMYPCESVHSEIQDSGQSVYVGSSCSCSRYIMMSV